MMLLVRLISKYDAVSSEKCWLNNLVIDNMRTFEHICKIYIFYMLDKYAMLR